MFIFLNKQSFGFGLNLREVIITTNRLNDYILNEIETE